ncbi:hypothetical protein APHAL10511_001563 [Amanita phalloides]|nr:hypothetical protein APHAL10511_001563 [Amanita phalloides]
MADSSESRGRSTVSKVLSASDTSRPQQDEYGYDDNKPSSSPCSSRSVVSSDEDDIFTQALPKTSATVNAAAPADKLDFNFWSNMNATLDACFDTSIRASNNEEPLDTMSDVSIEEAPRVIQMFLSHGDACTRIEGEALELVSNEPTARGEEEQYIDMLHYLELLQEKAALLESAISRLACQAEEQQSASEETEKCNDGLVNSKAAANANLRRVFAACLSVLRARKENLTVAQDLVDSAQENISISLRMEYLDMD